MVMCNSNMEVMTQTSIKRWEESSGEFFWIKQHVYLLHSKALQSISGLRPEDPLCHMSQDDDFVLE